MKRSLEYLVVSSLILLLLVQVSGCANIVPPGGGPRDSIPPVLVEATPPDSSTGISPKTITLSFDEYIDQLQSPDQIIVSPTPEKIPTISSKLRTVTIKFNGELEPNTTYSVQFGNSIKDVNEGNILRGFTYVFSTGKTIDRNILAGTVILAETGSIDSSLVVLLHSDLSDSAISKRSPRYYTRLDGSGNFRFNHLPEGKFAVYVLPGTDPLRRYDDSTEMFAFLDSPVAVSPETKPVTLYAYEQVKRKAFTPGTPGGSGKTQDRRLRYTNPEGNIKDVLSPLQLEFTRRLGKFDTTRFMLTDTAFNELKGYTVHLDSNRTRVQVSYPWSTSNAYRLIVQKDAVADVDGVTLSKTDTLRFITRKSEDYGEVTIRFNNLDVSRNPVLQVVQNNIVIDSAALTGREFKRRLFRPGEYELRILYDTNNNLSWDPGNFLLKKQPEFVLSLKRRLSVRANWENELDINL
ncbi:MAG TPA: Ig-like domain-containing protein [Chitinophagaceae bacterium]